MNNPNWSQFIPDLLVSIIGVCLTFLLAGIIAYIRSKRFRKFIENLVIKVKIPINILEKSWKLVVIGLSSLLLLIILRNILFIIIGLLLFILGLLLGQVVTVKNFIRRKKNYVQIKLFPGIGNSKLSKNYITPPEGRVVMGGIPFTFAKEEIVFDTSESKGITSVYDDGSEEVEIKLETPLSKIRNLYFLINSGNSNSLYKGRIIGEIRLIFKDAPIIKESLILGNNIREWCPGNRGDYVREASNPKLHMSVWNGMSKGGANAVIDCLEIKNYECMKSVPLEKIKIKRKYILLSPDTMGVHFMVFGIVIETN